MLYICIFIEQTMWTFQFISEMQWCSQPTFLCAQITTMVTDRLKTDKQHYIEIGLRKGDLTVIMFSCVYVFFLKNLVTVRKVAEFLVHRGSFALGQLNMNGMLLSLQPEGRGMFHEYLQVNVIQSFTWGWG